MARWTKTQVQEVDEVDAPGVTGPKAYYRPKDPPAISILLTAEGKKQLEALKVEHGKGRGDIIEHLIRRFGPRVKFPA